MLGTIQRKPNFLFIGPDKTGSSWLYQILAAHPDCCVPEIKDIYFFDRYYSKGLDWYCKHFKLAADSAKAVGELSHDYLFSAEAAYRIERDLPGVKLITCLRNPVDRTFSHYLYLLRSGLTKGTFEEALQAFPELIDNSLYAKHLSRYYDVFDRADILVLMFDELKKNPRNFAGRVFEFIAVPFVDDLPFEEKVLAASRARVPVVAKAAKLGANLARAAGMSTLVGKVKTSRGAGLLYKDLPAEEKPSMNPDTRRYLWSIFADDIGRVESLLTIDLSSWANSEKSQ